MLGQRLSVDIYSIVVFLLRPMNNDPAISHPGSPDSSVGVPHHYGGDTTLEIAACPGVGLPPLGGKASGQAFQHDLHPGNQQAVGEGGLELMKLIIQVLMFPPALQLVGFLRSF